MKHLRFSTARQVIDAFPNLRGEFSGNLELDPFAFIDSLIAQGNVRKAMAFCAFVLPRREAVRLISEAWEIATRYGDWMAHRTIGRTYRQLTRRPAP